MICIHVDELLKKKNKTKYWLCKNMHISTENLNRVIRGETSAISFKYLEDFCKYLECGLDELVEIKRETKKR